MDNLTQDSILLQMQPIFQEVLDEVNLLVTRESNAMNTQGWDSLAHVELIEMIERHFRVRFSLTELQEANNAGDLVDLVARKTSCS